MSTSEERQKLRSGSPIIDYSNPMFNPSDETHREYKWCYGQRMHDFDAEGKCKRCKGVSTHHTKSTASPP
jgi:hypothetical protein